MKIGPERYVYGKYTVSVEFDDDIKLPLYNYMIDQSGSGTFPTAFSTNIIDLSTEVQGDSTATINNGTPIDSYLTLVFRVEGDKPSPVVFPSDGSSIERGKGKGKIQVIWSTS